MKKAIIIFSILFITTLLIPLISFLPEEKNDALQKNNASKEIVTIFSSGEEGKD